MVRIELTTTIDAPVQRCFDLSRSIDLHMASTDWTGERAIAGVVSGLIGLGQEVTWVGRHFGFIVTHTSRITAMDPPHYFQDCMLRGKFKSFCHDHFFQEQGDGILMRDQMVFEAPFGLLGRIVEVVTLASHMRNLLKRRNQAIKSTAESDEWKRYLGNL